MSRLKSPLQYPSVNLVREAEKCYPLIFGTHYLVPRFKKRCFHLSLPLQRHCSSFLWSCSRVREKMEHEINRQIDSASKNKTADTNSRNEFHPQGDWMLA